MDAVFWFNVIVGLVTVVVSFLVESQGDRLRIWEFSHTGVALCHFFVFDLILYATQTSGNSVPAKIFLILTVAALAAAALFVFLYDVDFVINRVAFGAVAAALAARTMYCFFPAGWLGLILRSISVAGACATALSLWRKVHNG